MRFFACGGAPVSPTLVKDATGVFENCAVFRIYGSTEAPTITVGTMERGTSRSSDTEGEIVGHDVRIVDEANAALICHDGEIITRGPEVMLSYLRQEDNEQAWDAEGFFHTGDIGRINADGTLTVTGRKKDIINRGGEKFSAREIEDILLRHPHIAEAAVIAMPHVRLGEAVCAVIVLQPGASLTQDEVLHFVASQNLAPQKTPERVEFVVSMPRTASGKIQKHVLKDFLPLSGP